MQAWEHAIPYTLGLNKNLHEIISDITLNNGQAKVINQRVMKNGVIYEIDGVLSIDTDLTDNTMMDVLQDLGCDWMIHYLFKGWLYDRLRGDGEFLLSS